MSDQSFPYLNLKPLIIAHRGFSARYPENTIAAFQAAVDVGAPMVELDVTLTKDQTLVVIHDDTVDRTTDGHGRVSDYSLEEVNQLDAGSWFDPRFAGERIPTLDEVLKRFADRMLMNIEIKTGDSPHPLPEPYAIARQVMETVYRHHAVHRVLISSFNTEVLANLAALPNPPALALLSEHPLDAQALQTCIHLNVYSWNPDYRMLDHRQAEWMHQAGIRVFPYTVNTIEAFEYLIGIGADGVFTNDPERLLQHVGNCELKRVLT